MDATIRAARRDDSPALRDIERLAGQRFRDVGLPHVADDEPASLPKLARYADNGRSWVATDAEDRPVGYVLVDIVDGCAHLEQMSVCPDQQGAGIGRTLLERVHAWATAAGLGAITLTTFADVPWNAPLFRHLGFRPLADEELGPELRQLRSREAAHGLDPMLRVGMRMELTAEPRPVTRR